LDTNSTQVVPGMMHSSDKALWVFQHQNMAGTEFREFHFYGKPTILDLGCAKTSGHVDE
jgi:hypothetical protein